MPERDGKCQFAARALSSQDKRKNLGQNQRIWCARINWKATHALTVGNNLLHQHCRVWKCWTMMSPPHAQNAKAVLSPSAMTRSPVNPVTPKNSLWLWPIMAKAIALRRWTRTTWGLFYNVGILQVSYFKGHFQSNRYHRAYSFGRLSTRSWIFSN